MSDTLPPVSDISSTREETPINLRTPKPVNPRTICGASSSQVRFPFRGALPALAHDHVHLMIAHIIARPPAPLPRSKNEASEIFMALFGSVDLIAKWNHRSFAPLLYGRERMTGGANG